MGQTRWTKNTTKLGKTTKTINNLSHETLKALSVK